MHDKIAFYDPASEYFTEQLLIAVGAMHIITMSVLLELLGN
jgi:hypothetical protein